MPLDAVAARRLCDRIGRLQDTQRIYEDPAVARLVKHGNFECSQSVFELGCGTGRLAANLLEGITRGGGCELACSFDIRIAALGRAVLGQPEVLVGAATRAGGAFCRRLGEADRLPARDRRCRGQDVGAAC